MNLCQYVPGQALEHIAHPQLTTLLFDRLACNYCAYNQQGFITDRSKLSLTDLSKTSRPRLVTLP